MLLGLRGEFRTTARRIPPRLRGEFRTTGRRVPPRLRGEFRAEKKIYGLESSQAAKGSNHLWEEIPSHSVISLLCNSSVLHPRRLKQLFSAASCLRRARPPRNPLGTTAPRSRRGAWRTGFCGLGRFFFYVDFHCPRMTFWLMQET